MTAKAFPSSSSRDTHTHSTVHTQHHQHQRHRKRSCPRPSCQFGSVGASLFDSLPWISALDQPQEHLADIADLSQIVTTPSSRLADDSNSHPHHSPSRHHHHHHHQKSSESSIPEVRNASGPVRRRRTSSRSNPLATSPVVHAPTQQKMPAETLSETLIVAVSPSLLPAMRGSNPPQTPSTPRSRSRDRKDLSRVRFRRLMPVFGATQCSQLQSPFLLSA
jgi:hypothetical protein